MKVHTDGIIDGAAYRSKVLDKLDEAYDEHGGETPDYIIFPTEVYESLKRQSRLEKITTIKFKTDEGYIGMEIWPTDEIPVEDCGGLLVSDEVMYETLPTAADMPPKDF
jgi:hypothetical protein